MSDPAHEHEHEHAHEPAEVVEPEHHESDESMPPFYGLETYGERQQRRNREREWRRVYDWRWSLHWLGITVACEEADEEARRDVDRLRARIRTGAITLPHEIWASTRVLRLLAREDWAYVVLAPPRFVEEQRNTVARVRIDGLPETP